MKFLHDKRSYGTTQLYDEELAKFQVKDRVFNNQKHKNCVRGANLIQLFPILLMYFDFRQFVQSTIFCNVEITFLSSVRQLEQMQKESLIKKSDLNCLKISLSFC